MNGPPMFLEDALGLTLREVLPFLQERSTSRSTYFGVPAVKSPLDLWIYQELIHRLRPDVIVEIGNHAGGSALALAHFFDALGSGRVIGVDVTHAHVHEIVRRHPRVTLIEGDACLAYDKVSRLIAKDEHVLVIEDSSHTYANTLSVLRTYSPLVKLGGYFIVEDGICHHGLDLGPVPGPYEAIEAFTEDGVFVSDRTLESFVITWNPKGFLRRVKEVDAP